MKFTIAAMLSVILTALLGAAANLAQSHALLLATMASAVVTIITAPAAAWQMLLLHRQAQRATAQENPSPRPPKP